MTADMAAVERMLKADAARGKKGPNSAATRPSGTSFGSKEPEEQETLEPSGDGGTERFQRPAPGSEEELAVMQAAWADENFRKAFYQQYGDKLEAAGIPCDGTFPGMQQLSQIPGQDPNGPRGLTITPEPGFVIKTKTLETNEKVFINFCKSPKVRSFSKEPDPNDATVDRVRIPLSLGPARNDLDKSGEPCVVYDVVFNTEVMGQALHEKEFKDFLVGLGMGWVMEKGGGGLDVKNFTEVKLRGNYKGKFPAMQVVRAEALIEEMEPIDEGGCGDSASAWQPSSLNPSSFSATRATAENSNYADSFCGNSFHKEGKLPGYAKVEEVQSGVETPQRRLYVDVQGGHRWAYQQGKVYQGEIQAFVIKVELPRMESANDADLDVTETLLSLEVEGKYELDVDLPYVVDDGAADAAWDRQKRVLTLTLPLKSWTAKAYAKARAEAADSLQHGTQDVADQKEPAPNADPAALEKKISAPAETTKLAEPTSATDATNESKEARKAESCGKEPMVEADASKKTREKEMKTKEKEASAFEAALKTKLQKQSEAAQAAAAKAAPRPILGSKEEQLEKERLKQGPSVSNRLPFRCERCNWGSAATAIRKCRRCHWCEPGSKEEAEAYEQAKEHEKFRASRKQDEVGAVEETGGIEDETSVRAFKFSCRMAWELDDDSPGWLEAVREKHYGGPQTDKHQKFSEVEMAPATSKEDQRKKEEQERVMPLPVKGLPTIEPLD